MATAMYNLKFPIVLNVLVVVVVAVAAVATVDVMFLLLHSCCY